MKCYVDLTMSCRSAEARDRIRSVKLQYQRDRVRALTVWTLFVVCIHVYIIEGVG